MNSEKCLHRDDPVAMSVTSQQDVPCNGDRNSSEAFTLFTQDYSAIDDADVVPQPLRSILPMNFGNQSSGPAESFGAENGTCSSPLLPLMHSGFPKFAEMFVDALKKNRSCQKYIRNKLIQIEARIEENKRLKKHAKCLVDYKNYCRRKMERVLYGNKDARVKLISIRKRRISKILKGPTTKSPAPCFAPLENSHASKFRMVLERFPVSFNKQPWSKAEKEKLEKGIKQQFQEMLLQRSFELYSSSEGTPGHSNDIDNMTASINNIEVTSEVMRSFLPQVDWDRLASMYFTGRSGAECETRWLNNEDPLINQNPWTNIEDKKLLSIVQQRGVFNWIDIAFALGRHRTPFQCLARYQRSLNAYILKKEWTEDDDAQLRAAVEVFGDNDWQVIASSMEGRTGPQCSNRWRKTLHPDRKSVGRWLVDEDKHLKVAVMLFGPKNWVKIAHFVPGRTQVQCRERWLNVLDPSLNLDQWTEEEDSKLLAAIAEHGHCWSKIASFVPPRTDCQCRRRWKVLLPHEVPLLQEARKMQKAALITNFVDRESERPLLGPHDFFLTYPSSTEDSISITNQKKKSRVGPKSRKRKDAVACDVPLEVNTKKSRTKSKAFEVTGRPPKIPNQKDKSVQPAQDDERIQHQEVMHIRDASGPTERRSRKNNPRKKPTKENASEPFSVGNACTQIVERQGNLQLTSHLALDAMSPNTTAEEIPRLSTGDDAHCSESCNTLKRRNSESDDTGAPSDDDNMTLNNWMKKAKKLVSAKKNHIHPIEGNKNHVHPIEGNEIHHPEDQSNSVTSDADGTQPRAGGCLEKQEIHRKSKIVLASPSKRLHLDQPESLSSCNFSSMPAFDNGSANGNATDA